jgi:phospholipid transport system substrate-binding protein
MNGKLSIMRAVTRTNRRLFFAGVALFLAVSLQPPRAFATLGGGAEAVRSLYSTLLSAMQNGPALGPQGRYAQIAPVVRRVFDIPLMTRIAVGPQWAQLGEAQRRQVTDAFARYIAAIYAERFDSYSGERLQVTGEQPSPGGAIITSRIVKSNGDPVNVNYLMRENDGVWQIADVYLDGTISELATRRSEFADILSRSGIAGLIEALDRKAASLAAASAS